MKQVMINLVQVQKSLKQGTYKEDLPMLTLLLEESIEELRHSKFQLDVFYTSENWKEHFATYEDIQKQYKYKLISEIRELQNELNKETVNELKVLVMMEEMINSKLYTSYVKRVVERFRPKQGIKKLTTIEV